MKKIEYTKIEHFIQDTSFLNWVNKTQLADIEFWNHWIVENPDKAQLVNDSRDILVGIKFNKSTLPESNVKNALDEFKKQLESRKNIHKMPFYKNRKIQTIAACVLLILGISTFYLKNNATIIEHKTAFGEILDINLPDGTKVKLNSNSKLTYNTKNNRDVIVKGEAFFNVEKKPSTNAKFLVTTEDLKVEVYGTAFNINNRNKNTQVFLEEGRIELKLNNGIQKKMVPGDLISYSSQNNKIIEEKRIQKPELQTSWKNGSLIFDKISLESAMDKIEDIYGISPIFEDDLSKKTLITGAVPTNKLDICIKIIEKSARVTITNKNNKLYVNKN